MAIELERRVTALNPSDGSDDLAADLDRWRKAHDHGTFEETFQALEAVVERLERGQMRLNDSVACYELGVRLARRCARILDEAELRVSQLDASLGSSDLWVDSADLDEESPADDENG
jgi:exodeoxyribonuclease VII small subunit